MEKNNSIELIKIELDDNGREARVLAGDYIVAKIYAVKEGLMIDGINGYKDK